MDLITLIAILIPPAKWMLAATLRLRLRRCKVLLDGIPAVGAIVSFGTREWGSKVANTGNLPPKLLKDGNYEVRVRLSCEDGTTEYKSVIEVSRDDAWVELHLETFAMSCQTSRLTQ